MRGSPRGGPQGRASEALKVVFRRALPEHLQDLLFKLQQSCPFFESMKDGEVAEFLRMCRAESYGAGALVFERGDPAGCMYVIMSGRVSIVPGDARKREARLGPGEAFGEMALIDGAPRSASVWTLEPSVLLAASAEVLEARVPLLQAKVMKNIARQIARHLREADAFIDSR